MSRTTSPHEGLPPHGPPHGPPGRAAHGPSPYQLPRLQLPELASQSWGGHHRTMGPASLSPGGGHPALFGSLPAATSAAPSIPALAAAQLSVARLHAQKRAYRQRRKDPSCDACRERKVKCDATETASCSECASRNVRCQFTKETNRRMSSSKQVQELERQLSYARQQLYHLRAVKNVDGPTGSASEPPSASVSRSQSPGVPSQRIRRQRPGLARDFSKVRNEIEEYSRGIFKPPTSQRQYIVHASQPRPAPSLPSREIADQLLGQFHTSVHAVLPILHWPTFYSTYESVYEGQPLQSVSPTWSAMLLSIMACGSIFSVDKSNSDTSDGKVYLDGARSLLDPWEDDYSVDHARVALLHSMFLFESNMKSAAWTCLGSAVRISQSLGLHTEPTSPHGLEAEMHRRVWWSIYVWDRLLSLELGLPLQIDDDDCDVDFPSVMVDQDSLEQTAEPHAHASDTPNSLLFNIEILRCLGPVPKARKAAVVAIDPLILSDTHLEACMSALPVQLEASAVTDPRSVVPVISLLNARLVLQRYNLSPTNAPDVRRSALDRCVAVSKDTSRFLSRLISELSDPASAGVGEVPDPAKLAPIATAIFCMHVWRCILFLCARGYYREAQVCARVSAAVGGAREVNLACGRHLAFFLACLTEWLRRGDGDHIDADEEMLALVSGDLQGDVERAWIWQDDDRRSERASSAEPLSSPRRLQAEGHEAPLLRSPEKPSSSRRMEDPGPDPWRRVLELLHAMLHEQTRRHIQDRSPTARTTSSLEEGRPSSTKISIADII